jgi:hypothetical protein
MVTKEGKNVEPTVIPSKSHTAAVFISTYEHTKHRVVLNSSPLGDPQGLPGGDITI